MVHQLLDGGPLAARVAHASERRDLWAHLHRRTGLPEAWWQPQTSPDGTFSERAQSRTNQRWQLCFSWKLELPGCDRNSGPGAPSRQII
jgi:hypothetical protein